MEGRESQRGGSMGVGCITAFGPLASADEHMGTDADADMTNNN
jgi:hypothetical protein